MQMRLSSQALTVSIRGSARDQRPMPSDDSVTTMPLRRAVEGSWRGEASQAKGARLPLRIRDIAVGAGSQPAENPLLMQRRWVR